MSYLQRIEKLHALPVYREDFDSVGVYREAMMVKFWKIAGFGRLERAVLVKAALLIPCVALGLRILGCKRALRVLARCADSRKKRASTLEAARLMELTHLAAVHHPINAACLVESLTTWFLLQRGGIDARIRIAFRKNQGLQGHAWVELAECPDEEPFRSSPAARWFRLEPAGSSIWPILPSGSNPAPMRIPTTQGEE